MIVVIRLPLPLVSIVTGTYSYETSLGKFIWSSSSPAILCLAEAYKYRESIMISAEYLHERFRHKLKKKM